MLQFILGYVILFQSIGSLFLPSYFRSYNISWGHFTGINTTSKHGPNDHERFTLRCPRPSMMILSLPFLPGSPLYRSQSQSRSRHTHRKDPVWVLVFLPSLTYIPPLFHFIRFQHTVLSNPPPWSKICFSLVDAFMINHLSSHSTPRFHST